MKKHISAETGRPYYYLDENEVDRIFFGSLRGNFTQCTKCQRFYLEPQSGLDLMPMYKNFQSELCPRCR